MLRLIALLSFAGLIAVWVVYPCVIAALAAVVARRRRAVIVGASSPRVSVILATRESVEATRARIQDCLRTAYDPTKLEIVVGCDRSSVHNIDALSAIAENVRVVVGDAPCGKGATLNAAVRASQGEILAFTDVHQRFDPDAIAKLVDALRVDGVGAVSGSLEIPKTDAGRSVAERYWLFERWLRSQEARIHSCPGVTGAIWAMRRELWLPLPDHLINDDMYTPMHIVMRGQRVSFARDAHAFETRRHDASEEFARKVRTLTGVIQICAWLPDVLNPVRNPIWVQFVFHKLLRLLTPYWVAVIALWLAVRLTRWFGREMFLIVAFAVIATALAYLVRARAVKRTWDAVVSGTLLQAAAIMGTVNGLRGRWNVWGASVSASDQQ